MGWDQLVPHGPVEMLLCLGVVLCIVVCRELGLLDLDVSLWLVPRQMIEDRNLIHPNQRMANGGLV